MNVGTQSSAQTVNVLPLFGNFTIDTNVDMELDPLAILLKEAMLEDEQEEIQVAAPSMSTLVNNNHHPDQSMYLLDDQLTKLKESLTRMKFYLGELDDLLPR